MFLLVLVIVLLFSILFGLMRLHRMDLTLLLEQKVVKLFKSVHFISFSICLAIAITYYIFNIGLRGLWTTRIIIFICFLTALVYAIIGDKGKMHRSERMYFGLFPYFPIFFLLCFFYWPLLSIPAWLFSPASYVHYDGTDYRVQSTSQGIFKNSKFEVFEKNFIFEKKLENAFYYTKLVPYYSTRTNYHYIKINGKKDILLKTEHYTVK